MQDVFEATLAETRTQGGAWPWRLFWREMRDWPGAVRRAHQSARKGSLVMSDDSNPFVPLTRSEMIVAVTLFVLPSVPAAVKFIFGYQPITNAIGSGLTIGFLVFAAVALVLGLLKGTPRWSVPFLGIAVAAIVMLELSWRIWGLIYQPVQTAIGYYARTLEVRVLYSATMQGFSWFTTFIAAIVLVILLAIWPRTRRLAQTIRRDWTLLSLMLYSGVVFGLQLVFEEYAYDELWKIGCWVVLALGAWIYFRGSSPHKRILPLLVGVTLVYWTAAVGKWHLVPLQSWGAFRYGHEINRRVEFWSTLAEWGWAILFMLIPSLLALLPRIPEPYVACAEEEELFSGS
jgi:hypothetical protein